MIGRTVLSFQAIKSIGPPNCADYVSRSCCSRCFAIILRFVLLSGLKGTLADSTGDLQSMGVKM